MRGNTLTEFMDDLYSMGGPEKEFVFHGRRYFLQALPFKDDPNQTELTIFECFGDENCLYRFHALKLEDCVHQFEAARIFDGMTIYEAEQDIVVEYG